MAEEKKRARADARREARTDGRPALEPSSGERPSAAAPSAAPSTEELRALWDAPGAAVVVIDRELRIRSANAGFAKLVMGADRIAGRHVRDVAPLTADAAEALVARALDTGEPVVGAHVPSTFADLSLDILPVDAGGADPRVVAVVTDAPRRAFADEAGVVAVRRGFLDVAQRMVTASTPEAGDAICAALEFAVAVYGLDRAYVRLFTDDESHLRAAYERRREGIAPLELDRIDRADVGWGLDRFAKGEVVVLTSPDDVPPGEAAFHRAIDRIGARALISVPVRDGPDVLGFVAYTMGEPHAWSGWAVALLRMLGDMIAAVVLRVRAQADYEDRLRFEELLSETARRFVSVPDAEVDAEITRALERHAAGPTLDRAAVLLLDGDGQLSVTHEWCAPGAPSLRTVFARGALSPIVHGVLAGEPTAGRAEDAPPGSDLDQLLRQMGAHTFAMVPVFVDGVVKGVLTLQLLRPRAVQRSVQIARTKLVAEIVSAALTSRVARERVRRLERRFAQIIASAMDGVVLVDPAGTVVQWTPQAAAVLGRTRDEMIGKKLASVVTPESHASLAARLAAALEATSAPQRFELTCICPDGPRVPIELSMMRLEDDEGVLVAAFVRDITDRKAAEAERQRVFDEVARQKKSLERERDYLREERGHTAILGESPAIRRALELVEAVADTNSSVLLLGESGVGKEVFAGTLHAMSARARGPFVKVNCASVPDSLFESEFFGHVKGSFTGAVRDRVGRFELADRGTLFLDEVGEIPLELQAKLLRAIQEGEIERVGEERVRRLDVRILASTNRDLDQEVQAGRFRSDLYFRLGVFPIQIPPLRERGSDVLLLARHFLARRNGSSAGISSASRAAPPLTLTADDEARLLAYDWPGNVRELDHVIERAVILSRTARDGPRRLRLDLALPSRSGRPPMPAEILREEDLRRIERDNLALALERSGGRVSGAGGAADLLGMSPSTLRDRMKALRLVRDRPAIE